MFYSVCKALRQFSYLPKHMAILETDIEVDVIDPDTASGKTYPYALQNFQTKAPKGKPQLFFF